MAKAKAPQQKLPIPKKALSPFGKVKAFHFAIGVDLVGSKTSMSFSPTMDLEAVANGIVMYSKNTGRTVVIPYSNVKGYELFPAADEAKA